MRVINISLGRWSIFILGTIDGLLYTAASILYERLYRYIELYLQPDVESHGFNILYSTFRDPIWYWYGIGVWNVIFFSIASYLVHRYWSHVKSIFWRWQMIGIAAVTGFYLLRLCFELLNNYLTGKGSLYHLISSSESRLIPVSLVVVMLTNLIFAAMLRPSLNRNIQRKIHSYN